MPSVVPKAMKLRTVVRIALVLGLWAAAAGAAYLGARRLLPPRDMVAQGLIVGGEPVRAPQSVDEVVADRVDRCADHRIRLLHGATTLLTATVGELGAPADRVELRRRVAAVGRSGSLWQQLDDALEARRGRLAVTISCRIPLEELARRLAATKAAMDRLPRPARWKLDDQTVIAHEDGSVVDVAATARAIEDAAASGDETVDLVVAAVSPIATSEFVRTMDRSTLLSRYETRFAYLGGQAGRAQNIRRATSAVDGTVLVPGEIVSFNALVGPRSVDNGFARAGEIYKGEMRMGVGGGTCQVASTLYSAAYFAAMDIVQRSPHSRPSGYVPLGLDATVAYPHVDLRLRNPFPFPVLVQATVEPGRLTFELWGERQPAKVEYHAATIKVRPYKRKIRKASWLAEGRIVRKQKGIRGLTVRKLRRIRFTTGPEQLEETTDEYPATNEVYLVPPGTDVDAELPPLPEGIELDA